jgi:hypothetical protein
MKTTFVSFGITIVVFCIVAVIGLLVTLCIEYPLTIAPLVLFVVIWFSIYKYIEMYYEE